MQNRDWSGNGHSIFTTLGASNHTEKEREADDYYATDPIAIDKLFAVELPPHDTIWECACGGGHLSERIKAYGYNVLNSDIKDRGYTDHFQIHNFLETSASNIQCDIITNPPYKYALEFVLKALEILAPGYKCYMFLKLQFLEGKKRFEQLFSKTPPKTVYVFSERILCAKNGEFQKMRDGGGSAVAYAWFVWEAGWSGTTEIKWI